MIPQNISNYRLFHHEGDIAIDNDLMVGGSLNVAQHARFKRTVYVEGTLVYRHLRGMDCGLFDTIEALQRVHPSPHRGQWAIVGTTVDQLALYACQTHGLWTLLSDGQSLAEALHYDEFVNGPITLDKVPEIQQYIDTLIQAEIEARQAAIDAERNARDAAIAAERQACEAAISAEREAREAAIAAEQTARQAAIADLMLENGIHELRFVNLWADDGNLPSLFSGYAWHGTAHVLYHRSGTLVEAEMPRTDILYVDAESNRLFRWTGSEMVLLSGAASGNQNNPSNPNIPSNTPQGWGEPDFQDPYRPEYYLMVDGELVRESAELQAAVKWGEAYYDWPLRCFNGSIDGQITIETHTEGGQTVPTSYDAEVSLPGERIIHKHGVPMEFTTDDVVYSTYHHCFVLRVPYAAVSQQQSQPEYKYYKTWNNYYEWTRKAVSGATYKPRVDCLFSDIHIEDDLAKMGTQSESMDFRPETTGQSRRVTYVYDNVLNQLVGITDTMTDFTKAVHDCIQSTEGGKKAGDMHLSDRIYYMGDIGKYHPLTKAMYGTGEVCTRYSNNSRDVVTQKVSGQSYNPQTGNGQLDSSYYTDIGSKSGFTIDGGRGVLFVRSHASFTPKIKGEPIMTVWNLNNAKDCVLRNLTMRALRDRDNGGVGTDGTNNVAISSSDSCLNAFKFSSNSENILLENIDVQGFWKDFSGNNHLAKNITVRKMRSRDFVYNQVSGTGWTFEDCDLVQRDTAGTGSHIFYPQGVWQVVFRNSRLHQGRYASVAIGLHEIADVGEVDAFVDMRFEESVIEGGYLTWGVASIGIPCEVVFTKCQIRQIYDKVMMEGGENTGYSTFENLFGVRFGKYTLQECEVSMKTGSVFAQFNDGGAASTQVYVRDTDIITEKPGDGSIIALDAKNAGRVTFENVRSNYVERGGAIYYDPQQLARDIDAKVVSGVALGGATRPSLSDVPLGYCFFDTSLGTNGKPIWVAANGWVDAMGAAVE